MLVVPLSSPLSSSGKSISVEYEKESSSVSSLIVDYELLSSIVESNPFETSLDIYASMIDKHLNPLENLPGELYIDQFIEEYSRNESNELRELLQILARADVRSVLSSYYHVVRTLRENKSRTTTSPASTLSNNEGSMREDQSSYIEQRRPNGVPDVIDDEKENSNYASKLAQYSVARLKIVRLEKRQGEPLGATISRLSDNDYRVSIARIVHGSLAQGLFSVGDQLLEVNQVPIQSPHRTLDEIVQLIDSLHGTISFLLLPGSDQLHTGIENHGFHHSQDLDECSSKYVRALFSYDPYDDIYIPCRELGLAFDQDSVLNIVNQEDASWWQAFIMEADKNSKKRQLPGLVPSRQFQEKRFKIVKCLLDEETNHSKKRFKRKFSKSIGRQSTRQTILTTFSFHIYEPVEWYTPRPSSKRPIVLIGPPHIGRHELRQRLMNSAELSTLIDVAVPHTTRPKKPDEIDGRDYHFVSREQFETDIANDLFVEHGEYEKNLYGTSKSAIEACCQSLNKICILNLLPQGLESLKHSNIVPFVIYLKAPSVVDKLKEYLDVSQQQFAEIETKSRFIEQNYSHLFDKTIHLTHSFEHVFSQLKHLVKDVQTRPMWVNQCWFSPRERF